MKVTHAVLAMTVAASALIANAQQPASAAQPGQGQSRQGPPPQGRGVAPGGRRMAPMPGGPGAGQMPGGPGMMMAGPLGGGGIASMLLAHSAELKLTDQQLSKLAAIARHTDDRHKAMRASMDSLMRANRPQADGTAPANPRPLVGDQGRDMITRIHDQERADLRDALAVLTIDQQTDAWMMRGVGPRGPDGPPAARFGAMRSRRGE
jgi:hypothetical protein